jgi:hypothetical protein
VDVIPFDKGGTTAEARLIDGRVAEIAPMMEVARVHRFKRGSGLPIKAPLIVASSRSAPPESWTLPGSVVPAENRGAAAACG